MFQNATVYSINISSILPQLRVATFKGEIAHVMLSFFEHTYHVLTVKMVINPVLIYASCM